MALKFKTISLSDGLMYKIGYFLDNGSIDLRQVYRIGMYPVEIDSWPLKDEAIRKLEQV